MRIQSILHYMYYYLQTDVSTCLCTNVYICLVKNCLTGSPTVTTPSNLTILIWWNCPFTAASCKNFIFSTSDAPVFIIFTATSTSYPPVLHNALLTVANCPDPRYSITLQRKSKIITHVSRFVDNNINISV